MDKYGDLNSDCLIEYFEKRKIKPKELLERFFIWGDEVGKNVILEEPKCFNIFVEGENAVERNIDLFRKLSQRLKVCDKKEQVDIAEYYIKRWGGIRSFNQADKLVNGSYKFQFEGISSWSKWLSIANEKSYIYDSRVAYALNAIGFIEDKKFKIFPVPPGANRSVNLLDIETILLAKFLNSENATKEFFFSDVGYKQKKKELKQVRKKLNEKFFMSTVRTEQGQPEVYKKYCNLIEDTAHNLWPRNTNEPGRRTEMLLFCLADTLIFQELLSCFK